MKLSRMQRIVAALLLTLALVADGYEIGRVAGLENAALSATKHPLIVRGRKVYFPDGGFKGCEVGGTNCWIINAVVGQLTISSEGLGVQ